jgi:hypothetical protein
MKGVFVLFIIAAPLFASAQFGFPGYREVLQKFYSLYQPDDDAGLDLQFARKKDGWYVRLFDRSKNNSLISDQVFWSQQKGRYQVLEGFLRANDVPLDQKVSDHIYNSNFRIGGYARFRYFGYDGWDIDMIKDFGNAASANDTLLEGLTAAYGLYATRLLWYQYPDDSSMNYALPKKLGRLEMPDDERIKTVEGLLSKAVESCHSIYARNKDYEVFEKNIATLCFETGMMAYLQMMIANRPAEAKKFLERSRLSFDDSVAAQNMLSSVRENAILFTAKETDTYPLWYLQEKYNIRKDVAVINTNMLALPAYSLLLKRAGTINFLTTPADLENKQMDFSLYYSPNNKTVKKSLPDFIKQYNRLPKMPVSETDSAKVYDATHLYFPVDKSAKDTFQFRLGNYLLITDFIFFDIINSNYTSRSIYFSQPNPPYLSDLAVASGIAHFLKVQSNAAGNQESIDQETYIREKYKAPFTNFSGNSQDYFYHLQTHTDLYFSLINEAAGKDKQALNKLVQAWYAPFNKHTPYILSIDMVLPLLYANGHESLADKLAVTYATVTANNSLNKLKPEYYDKEMAIRNISRVKAIVSNYQRSTDLVDQALAKVSNN